MAAKSFDTAMLQHRAHDVAGILGAVANEKRLLTLCTLVESGEANVTELADAVGLGQSALSQHLAKLREQGIVAYRRDAQTLWYRIADPRVEELFLTLHRLFCTPNKRTKA